jgi:hypothetical protein
VTAVDEGRVFAVNALREALTRAAPPDAVPPYPAEEMPARLEALAERIADALADRGVTVIESALVHTAAGLLEARTAHASDRAHPCTCGRLHCTGCGEVFPCTVEAQRREAEGSDR